MRMNTIAAVAVAAGLAGFAGFALAKEGTEAQGPSAPVQSTPAQEALDEIVQGAGPQDYVAGPSVTNIRSYAFAECRHLRSFTAENAKTVGRCAFVGCTSLRSVTLPSVAGASLPQAVFSGCARLTSVRLPGVTLADAKTSGFPWQTPSQAVVFYLADGDYDRNGRKLD